MKFRMRMLILAAVTVIVICTYFTVIRPDISVHSDSVDNNDYIDIPDSRIDEWDFGPDPKWVQAVRASYNSSKSTQRPRTRRLTLSERVNKYINTYQPKWSYRLNTTSPWSIASKWVTSRQIVGVEATELGINTVFTFSIVQCVYVVILSVFILCERREAAWHHPERPRDVWKPAVPNHPELSKDGNLIQKGALFTAVPGTH